MKNDKFKTDTGPKNNRPMRVSLLQNTLSPYRIPLFEKISKHPGVDFKLFLMADEKPSYPQWKWDYARLPFRAELVPGIRIKLPQKNQICINPTLLLRLIHERPDIVFCCGFTLSTLWAFLYKIITGKSCVIWTEATEWTERFRGFNTLRTIIRRIFARAADGFIEAGVLSKKYVENLLPQNNQKIFTRSYNAIDAEKFASDIRRFINDDLKFSSFRKRFPERNILFSGRLVENKGLRQMIEVYERVLELTKENIGLIILGQGGMRSYLEEVKKEKRLDHLYLEGFRGPEDYYRYFAIADLFILLSHSDCNPLVIFEALTAGLPIVCTRYAGNAPDFIYDGYNGYIVDPFDVDDVASKIIEILNKSDLPLMGAYSLAIGQKANYSDSALAFVRIAEKITGIRCSKIEENGDDC